MVTVVLFTRLGYPKVVGMMYVVIVCSMVDRHSASIMRMMKYGMRGMEMLQDKYCKYIRVTEDIRHGKE